jgi:3-hydroxypropanoate dehydrogenase
MQPIATDALDQVFLKARTQNGWRDEPVPDELIRRLHEVVRWGPTASNSQPARFLFVKSPEAKAKLVACMAPGNVEKTRTAPVTVVVAIDTAFHLVMPKLYPHADLKTLFANDRKLAEESAFRNGSLQGAYLILAARALGLDTGPMSGFDQAKLDQTFFSGTSWKANFVCALGYGDPAKVYPRLPRLEFEEAAKIV